MTDDVVEYKGSLRRRKVRLLMKTMEDVYAVLRGRELTLYRSREDHENERVMKRYTVSGYQEWDGKGAMTYYPHGFELEFQHGRSSLFQAKSETEKVEWLRCVAAALGDAASPSAGMPARPRADSSASELTPALRRQMSASRRPADEQEEVMAQLGRTLAQRAMHVTGGQGADSGASPPSPHQGTEMHRGSRLRVCDRATGVWKLCEVLRVAAHPQTGEEFVKVRFVEGEDTRDRSGSRRDVADHGGRDDDGDGDDEGCGTTIGGEEKKDGTETPRARSSSSDDDSAGGRGGAGGFSEWVRIQSSRLALPDAPLPPAPEAAARVWKKGEFCLALDIYAHNKTGNLVQKWREAEIVDVTRGGLSVKLHFSNWGAEFDEWLKLDEIEGARRICSVGERSKHEMSRGEPLPADLVRVLSEDDVNPLSNAPAAQCDMKTGAKVWAYVSREQSSDVRGGGGGDGGGGRSAATDAPSGWRPATLRARNRRSGSQVPSDVVRLDGREHRVRGDVVLPSSERGSPVYVILRQPPTDVQLGLCNLGNTCYMSAVLQCLSHTPVLQDYFLGGCWKNELNPTNFMGSGGVMAKEYFELARRLRMKPLWQSSFTPENFKAAVDQHMPLFQGYHQQDAAEFLQQLLDKLHEDLNRVQKKPLTEDKDSEDRPDAVVAAEYWTNFMLRNDSHIANLLFGQEKRAVTCTNCGYSNAKFLPMNTVTLALPSSSREITREVIFVPASEGGRLTRFGVSLPKNGTLQDMREKLAKLVGKQMTETLLFKQTIKNAFNDEKELSEKEYLARLPADLWLYAYAMPDEAASTSEQPLQTHVGAVLQVRSADDTGAFKADVIGSSGDQLELRRRMMDTVDYDGPYGPSYQNQWEGEGEELVGCTIEVRWAEGRQKVWYEADVVSYDKASGKHRCEYTQDEDVKMYLMAKKNFRIKQYATFMHPMHSSDLSMAPAQTLYLDVLQLRPSSRSWYGSGSNSNEPFAMPLVISATSRSTCRQLHRAVWQAARRLLPDSSGMDERAPPYELQYRNQRGVASALPFDDSPCPRLLKDQYPGHRGTTNLLCILWKDDVAASVEEMCTPDDDEDSMQRLRKTRGTDIDLGMLFDLYLESENTDYNCPKCKAKHGRNTTKFWRFPDVLILQLKRFDWDAGRKISVPVKIEESIDLAPWLESGAQTDGRETVFELFGVVNHYGSMRGGHYTAFCRRSQGWFEFDDQRVRPFRRNDTLDPSAAYILFLRRHGLGSAPK